MPPIGWHRHSHDPVPWAPREGIVARTQQMEARNSVREETGSRASTQIPSVPIPEHRQPAHLVWSLLGSVGACCNNLFPKSTQARAHV
jgi:hypothetical protein